MLRGEWKSGVYIFVRSGVRVMCFFVLFANLQKFEFERFLRRTVFSFTASSRLKCFVASIVPQL